MLSQQFLQEFCKWCFAYEGGLDWNGQKWRYKETAIAALIQGKNSPDKRIREQDCDWDSSIEEFCYSLMRNMLNWYCGEVANGGCFCTDENIQQLARLLKESVGIQDG